MACRLDITLLAQIVIYLTGYIQNINTQVVTECVDQLDLVFIVDSSLSIRESSRDNNNWELVKGFVWDVGNRLPVEDDVQIGIVVYSTKVHHITSIQNWNKNNLREKIKSLPYDGGNTNTADALESLTRQMFVTGRDREHARNVAIVVTDGMSNIDPELTITKARDAKTASIDIFTIGISEFVNIGELQEVASDPATYFHFWASDFTNLNLLLDQLLGRVCEPPPPPDACADLQADVTFLLDSSGSIQDNSPDEDKDFYWRLLKEFVGRVVQNLRVSSAYTQVAVVKYSNEAEIEFDLDDYSNSRKVQEAVKEVGFVGYYTNTSGAIRVMHSQIFTPERGDRPNITNIGIIVTDGKSTKDENLTLPEAEIAKDKGVRLFTVGLTDQINMDELIGMASEPVQDHLFNTTRFEDVENLVSRLVWRVCHEVCATQPDSPLPRCHDDDETVCGVGYSLHWERHSDHLLVGHNYARIDHVGTPDECMDFCLQDPKCRSVDYVKSVEECAISYVTRREEPSSFLPDPDVDYYEWLCVSMDPDSDNDDDDDDDGSSETSGGGDDGDGDTTGDGSDKKKKSAAPGVQPIGFLIVAVAMATLIGLSATRIS